MIHSTPIANFMAAPSSSSQSEQYDNKDRSRFSFQNQWFENMRPEWEQFTCSLRGKKLRILEIGAFEGASTTWILDNLMSHPESTMTVVDTFEGGMEHQNTSEYELSSLESRFRANVSKCEHARKLRVMKAHSDDALPALKQESSQYDFIYIDASHVSIDVLYDAVLCWRMLTLHGTMVFDDWRWKGYMEDCYNPRIAIIAFLQCAAPEVETKETIFQMWVTKVPNRIAATPNLDPEQGYWDDYNPVPPCSD